MQTASRLALCVAGLCLGSSLAFGQGQIDAAADGLGT